MDSLFCKQLGKGIPIVFIHPPGMGHKVFLYQENLSASFHVLFPDLSGQGKSPRKEREVTIAHFAMDIVELLDENGLDKAVICGYSAGGLVAQHFAITYPERLLGLILIGGFPKVDSFMLDKEFLIGMKLVQHDPEHLAYVIARSHTDHITFQHALQAYMLLADREVWYTFYERGHEYDCSDKLSSIEAPLLLLYGSRETWMQKHIPYYHVCPDATLHEIPRAFHQLPSRQSVHFNRAVEQFIEKHISPTIH